jgi:hypothetical protein
MYLRSDIIPSIPDRDEQRSKYFFYTDRYVKGSLREMRMEYGTRDLIREFLLHNDECDISWSKVSDDVIKMVLLE